MARGEVLWRGSRAGFSCVSPRADRAAAGASSRPRSSQRMNSRLEQDPQSQQGQGRPRELAGGGLGHLRQAGAGDSRRNGQELEPVRHGCRWSGR